MLRNPTLFLYDSNKFNRQSIKIRKCLNIIREFHYYYSFHSSDELSNSANKNSLCKKIQIESLQKLQQFDKIAFGRNTDKIRYFKLCSHLKNWYVAVFHARVLQIYDQLTGTQEYEINMPSCRGINFLD